MKKSVLILFLLIASISTQCQTTEVKTLLNFEDKTIRLCFSEEVENNPAIQILTVWDKPILNLVADPANAQNTVLRWEKSSVNQTYGGLAFTVSDAKNGLNAKDWQCFSYKIWASAPIQTSLLRFLTHGEISIFEDVQVLNIEPNKWYTVKHAFNESLLEKVNPVGIMMFPGGGDEMNGVILIDDIQLERRK